MSELIRREDAIKATWQEPSYTDPYNVLTEVRDRINALPTASLWHRVEDELPNKDEFVLAYEDGTIVMASFDGSKWWQFDLYELIDIDPSHWCDLPELPKEDA